MALREYQLTNFKAFAGPETIPVRPITLIYGPNSSGKSSILQSLLLLKQTLEEADSSTPLLPKGKLVDLGDYREFVHRHDVSKKFSFKTIFTVDIEKAQPEWIKLLLEAVHSGSVGLSVDFVPDDKDGTLVVSSVALFIGNESSPAVSYLPVTTKGSEFEAHAKIHPKHPFWRTWWAVMRQYIEDELTGDVDFVFYKRKVEDEPFKVFLSDLKNYSFEKTLEDLRTTNVYSSVRYRTFLPTSRGHLLEGFLEELQASIAENKVERDPKASPADLLEKEGEEDESPFDATIIYFSSSKREPFEGGLEVLPLTLHICSAFRQLLEDMIYLGPLRSSPERYYTFSGNPSEQVGQLGERLPDVLFQNPEILERINAEFGRFGLKYKLKLSVLRDENSNLSNVFAVRVVDKETDVSASIRDVGFGVSQVLPIIVQSLLSRNKTLLIEQPEIHLHPALQAELGDLFIQSALGEQKNTFILETHSEHLILRIMRRMRETFQGNLPEGLPPVRPEDVAVLYVERDGLQSIVREMSLNERGELVKAWPGGFFEEGLREVFA